MVALPAGHTGPAARAVLAAAVLEVVAAVALLPILAPGGALVARTSVALRIAYAAVFAVAGGMLFAPADEGRFHAVWDARLAVFGAHLVLAGVGAWRTGFVPRWTTALVGVAGAGDAADSVAKALRPGFDVPISAVTFVGEVVLLCG